MHIQMSKIWQPPGNHANFYFILPLREGVSL